MTKPSFYNLLAAYCHWCKMYFEPIDDGTITSRDPAVQAEKREAFQLREAARRRRADSGRAYDQRRRT